MVKLILYIIMSCLEVTAMKIVLCVFLLLASAHCEKKSFHGDKVYRLTPKTKENLDALKSFIEASQLDVWKEARFIGDSVDVKVSITRQIQFKRFLETSRVEYTIFIDDVQKLIDEQTKPHPVAKNLDSFDYDLYHPLEEVNQWMIDVENEYPSLITKHTLGTTFEGREFYALKVKAGDDENPHFVINCGIHAREWVSPASCMLSIYYLVTGYGIDSTITDLMDRVTFVFIPSSNPDGYAYTWTDDRLWRKTRFRQSTSQCVGIDPNRNWEVNFGGGGSSSSPCSSTYHGPSPYSANCVAAQKQFVEGLGNVQMYIDVHSYSQLFMYPYGYKSSSAENEETLNKIAIDTVNAIYDAHGKTYVPGPHYSTIYQASGITCDFYYEALGVPCSFLIELRDEGRYGFLLPAEQIRPTAEELFAGFMTMGQAIVDGKCVSKF